MAEADQRSDAELIRVALRGLLGRKLRAALTAFAIVLGVAMVSGRLLPHRLDRQGLGLDLQRTVRKGCERASSSGRCGLRPLRREFDTTQPPNSTTSRCSRRYGPSQASKQPSRASTARLS